MPSPKWTLRLEGLRDARNEQLVRQVVAGLCADMPWALKDAYAAQRVNRTTDCVRPLYLDAWHSPTVESRACAICVLINDGSRFDAMLVNGGLDETKVDAAVRSLGRAAHCTETFSPMFL